MKTTLGMMALAAGFVLAASAAYAADDQECHGGYRVIAGTPITCDGGSYTSAMAASAPLNEPRYTGSIAAPSVPAAENRMMMVSGPRECRPGAFWLMDNPNDDTPIACPR